MNRSSLFSRFAASTALLLAAVVVLAAIVFGFLYSDYFRGTTDVLLRGFSLSMAEVIWRDPELAQKVAERHQLGLVVDDPAGRYAFGPDGQPVDPEVQLGVGRPYRRIEAVGPEGRTITFFWDVTDLISVFIPPLVGLFVVLVTMIGVTYAFQLAQLRPLRWLRSGVEAVSRGDFSSQVPVARQDDIGRVAAAFNSMTQRVEEMITAREVLLGDVSHELRSPLTRIKVALELLPESRERKSMAKDVRAMEALIAALLDRQRVDAMDRSSVDVVDLAAVVREVVESFRGSSPGIDFSASCGPVEVRGDADLLRVLVHNLVDNAVKFSLPDGRPVEVELAMVNGAVQLIIRDDGPGIPEEDVGRVFEPFVKLDPSRGHRTGQGLGLDICRRIVEAHGGRIRLGKNGGRGTQVTVVLRA